MPEEDENLEAPQDDISHTTNSDVSRIVDGESKVEDSTEVKEDDLWGSLEDAGVSKKLVLNVAIFLILAVLSLVYVIFNLDNWLGGDSEPEVVEVEEVNVSNVARVESDVSGLITSYIVGLEFQKFDVKPISSFADDSGISTGLVLGDSAEGIDGEIFEYLSLVARIENAYFTDVYELVNKSNSRGEALDGHLEDLSDLILEAQAALDTLNSKLTALRLNYEIAATERDRYEVIFFDNLDALRGVSASDNLDNFLVYSKEAVEIKAYFSALASIEEKLDSALSYLRPRYRDIELNQEAILKGVYVFDVPRSDIDAIIPVE